MTNLNSCKESTESGENLNPKKESKLVTTSEGEVALIEDFITKVNYSVSNPTYSYDALTQDDAIEKIEHALNYSFSKVDKLFVNQFKNDSFTFNLTAENGLIPFYQIAVKSKLISAFIKGKINSTTRLVVAYIAPEGNSENSFRITLILGNIDETIELISSPTPPLTTGDHNWSYGESLNSNLGCQPGDEGAVKIIKELGTIFMVAHRNYGINQNGIAAPAGYSVYFNHYTPVSVAIINEFTAPDVSILSKFDWYNSFTAYCQNNSRIPYPSPIFYIKTESSKINGALNVTYPSYIPQNAIDFTFKCCLSESFINYSISKVDDIYERLAPASMHVFIDFIVLPYATDVYNGPIQHKYKFFKTTYCSKLDNPNMSL
ncbi:MAG: hypothetical protein H3C45_06820 [Bacteroidia bacterium]|nr:hypothetical protein [Bacteroidia bacterium]